MCMCALGFEGCTPMGMRRVWLSCFLRGIKDLGF